MGIENFDFFRVTYSRITFSEDSLYYTAKSCHVHNADEIVLVTRGESIITCEERIVHAAAPFIAYYPASVLHQQDNLREDAYERWSFPIFPGDIGGSAILPGTFFVLPLTDAQCGQFLMYIRILYQFWGCEEFPRENFQMHFEPVDLVRLKYLLLLFLNELRPLIPDTASAKSTYINDVCLYINEHLGERLTLDSLAGRFFVGRSTLTGDFRRTIGMSVVEFITTVRVNHAKVLLQGDLTLAEIAEKCGFSSVSYFIKVFTRHTGLSPTRWRDALAELP